MPDNNNASDKASASAWASLHRRYSVSNFLSNTAARNSCMPPPSFSSAAHDCTASTSSPSTSNFDTVASKPLLLRLLVLERGLLIMLPLCVPRTVVGIVSPFRAANGSLGVVAKSTVRCPLMDVCSVDDGACLIGSGAPLPGKRRAR